MRAHEYRALSPESGFSAIGPAVCTAVTRDDCDYFLSTAEVNDSPQGDADLRRQSTSGEVRTFNPFQPSAFEPQNAALVVLSYIQQAHQHLRPRAPRWLQRLYYSFVDRCILRLQIEHFSTLPPEIQRTFRSFIQNIPCVASIEIESDRNSKPSAAGAG